MNINTVRQTSIIPALLDSIRPYGYLDEDVVPPMTEFDYLFPGSTSP